jgi:putative phosphoesterase
MTIPKVGKPAPESAARGEVVVGVISDTHGLLRHGALEALHGSDLILHAGDVGGQDILTALEALGTVVAVRGNTDRGAFGASLPDTQVVEVAGVRLYVLHDLAALDLRPEAAGMDAVIFGHSHRPEVREERGVLYFNPGSAGPRRFDNPISVGRLHVRGGLIRSEIVKLKE